MRDRRRFRKKSSRRRRLAGGNRDSDSEPSVAAASPDNALPPSYAATTAEAAPPSYAAVPPPSYAAATAVTAADDDYVPPKPSAPPSPGPPADDDYVPPKPSAPPSPVAGAEGGGGTSGPIKRRAGETVKDYWARTAAHNTPTGGTPGEEDTNYDPNLALMADNQLIRRELGLEDSDIPTAGIEGVQLFAVPDLRASLTPENWWERRMQLATHYADGVFKNKEEYDDYVQQELGTPQWSGYAAASRRPRLQKLLGQITEPQYAAQMEALRESAPSASQLGELGVIQAEADDRAAEAARQVVDAADRADVMAREAEERAAVGRIQTALDEVGQGGEQSREVRRQLLTNLESAITAAAPWRSANLEPILEAETALGTHREALQRGEAPPSGAAESEATGGPPDSLQGPLATRLEGVAAQLEQQQTESERASLEATEQQAAAVATAAAADAMLTGADADQEQRRKHPARSRLAGLFPTEPLFGDGAHSWVSRRFGWLELWQGIEGLMRGSSDGGAQDMLQPLTYPRLHPSSFWEVPEANVGKIIQQGGKKGYIAAVVERSKSTLRGFSYSAKHSHATTVVWNNGTWADFTHGPGDWSRSQDTMCLTGGFVIIQFAQYLKWLKPALLQELASHVDFPRLRTALTVFLRCATGWSMSRTQKRWKY